MDTPDLEIKLVPDSAPTIPPSPVPEDSKLKELAANLAKRLDTLNASILDGNVKAEAQRADVKKLANLIMEDTSIGFDDFKKKIIATNLPNKLETKGMGFFDMISLFIPDICGDLSELLGFKREADKEHGTKTPGV